MNFDNYKFRASSIGKLMTNSRTKEPIGETTKKYLLDVYISEKYGRDREIVNKYIEKGLACEDNSMTLYCRNIKKFYIKNNERFENDYICGTPDIIDEDSIIDLKSSWSIHTFFDVVVNPINKLYYYQLQSYMALTGKEKSKLVYCLVDTPDPLIHDEIKRTQWKMGVSDPETNQVFIDASKYIEASMKFDDIPMKDRFIEFEIAKDNETIQSIYTRVEECRKFLNSIKS